MLAKLEFFGEILSTTNLQIADQPIQSLKLQG